MGVELAKEWLALAEDDLRQVTNNLLGPLPSLRGAAYHCQQAAEKLAKAVLVAMDRDFPRIHDIGALALLVPANHPLRPPIEGLSKLTPYGMAYRYPAEDDEWEVPSPDQIADWQDEIQSALGAVRDHFGG